MESEEQRILKQKASNGCALWLPIIVLLICRFIVGMPQEASKGGLIAYLVLAIISIIWLCGSAIGSKRMGMPKAALMFWLELVSFVGITIYLIVSIATFE